MLIGHGPTGIAHDFFVFDSNYDVWNGSGFVPWNDADYVSYRVAATELGTSGRFISFNPIGTVYYELRMRSGTLAASTVVDYGDLHSYDLATGVEEMKARGATGLPFDFFAFNSANQVYNPGTSTFVAWADGNYANYRIPAVESGTSGFFSAIAPIGTETYELRVRGGTLAGSPVVDSGTMTIVAGLPSTPSAPEQTTGFTTVFNNLGVAQGGILVTCTAADVKVQLEEGGFTQASGVALSSVPRNETSDVNGVVAFSGLFKGVSYVFKRGTGRPQTVTIPVTAGSSFQLPILTGTP